VCPYTADAKRIAEHVLTVFNDLEMMTREERLRRLA
jgi:hypothetical protein